MPETSNFIWEKGYFGLHPKFPIHGQWLRSFGPVSAQYIMVGACGQRKLIRREKGREKGPGSKYPL
jgi:hypothetical protein